MKNREREIIGEWGAEMATRLEEVKKTWKQKTTCKPDYRYRSGFFTKSSGVAKAPNALWRGRLVTLKTGHHEILASDGT